MTHNQKSFVMFSAITDVFHSLTKEMQTFVTLLMVMASSCFVHKTIWSSHTLFENKYMVWFMEHIGAESDCPLSIWLVTDICWAMQLD